MSYEGYGSPQSPDSTESLKRKVQELSISDERLWAKRRNTSKESEHKGRDKQQFACNEKDLDGFICNKCKDLCVDPKTIVECGHSYCASYITELMNDGQEYMRCLAQGCENASMSIALQSLVNDVAMEKSIMNLRVHCSNSAEGCKETPKLKLLQKHLQDKCLYSRVKCDQCLKEFLRKALDDHKRNCTSRVCNFHGVGCNHVVDESSKTATKIDSHAGLHLGLLVHNVRLKKEAFLITPAEIENRIKQVESNLTGLRELSRRLKESKDEAGRNEERINRCKEKIEEVKKHTEATLDDCQKIMKDRLPNLAERKFQQKRQVEQMDFLSDTKSKNNTDTLKLIRELPSLHAPGVSIYKITNFTQERTNAIKGDLRRLHGPKFYAADFSYLLCPIIYPNGDGAGAGSHLSVFLSLCKGPYDALLKWPMLARITLSILPQRRGIDSVKHTFRTDVASTSYHRPKNDMNPASGIPRTISLDLLRQPSNYLIDDCLFIKFEIELMSPTVLTGTTSAFV